MLARSTIRRTLSLAALFATLLSGIAAAESITVGWDWDQVRIDPTRTGEARIAVEGATLRLQQPGEPSLPAMLVEVRAPESHRVGAVEIVDSITSVRPLSWKISPVLLDAPTPAGGPSRVEDLVSAYQVPRFPTERVRFLGLGFRRGVAWAQFAVYPLVVEDGSAIRLLEHGSLEVEWIPDPSIPAPFKSLRDVSPAGDDPRNRVAPTGEGTFEISERPSLESAPVDYLILTTTEFEELMAPFAEWKSHTGSPTTIRTVTWVLENYTFGSDSQERIRNFLRDAYRYWGVQWLLIVGGPDEIPIRTAQSYAWNVPYGEEIITDLYYGCLDGSWNADGDALFGESRRTTPPVNVGDGVDFEPELYVGRIPARETSELASWLEKYFRYVQDPITDGYLDEILLLGEVLFDSDWTRALLPGCKIFPGDCDLNVCDACVRTDGAKDCADVHDVIETHAPGVMDYTMLFEWYEYWQENGFPQCQLETKANVVNEINAGVGLLHHVGHGDRDRMSIGTTGGSDGNGRYLVSDANDMSNGERVGVVYSINCNSAAIDFNCLGEAMIFASNGGMVAYIGSTNLDFPSAAKGYMDSFYSKIFGQEYGSIGEAYSRTISEQMAGDGDTESYRRFLAYSLILLGDPQMSLWLGTPSSLAISDAPSTIQLGESSLSLNVSRGGQIGAGATVCAYKEGDVYAVGIADESGRVDLPFRPTTVGSFRITVTHPQGIPRTEEDVRIVNPPSTTPPLSITGLAINDASGAETEGNGNDLFDEGETIKIDVFVHNGGDQTVSDVSLTLAIEPNNYADYIEVLDGEQTGLSFNPTTTAQVTGAFRIGFASDVTIPESSYQNGDRIPFVAKIHIQSSGQAEDFELPLPSFRPVFDLEGGTLVEKADTGNGDNIPETGETMLWTPRLRNVGSGKASSLAAYLTAVSGATVVVDSASVESGEFGDIIETTRPFEIEITDQYNLRLHVTVRSLLEPTKEFLDRTIDFLKPSAPSFPTDAPPSSTKDAVVLAWNASLSGDVQGYVLERSLESDTGFGRVNTKLVGEMQYYRDEGLAGLTPYYYRVAAVDSSGNWSAYSNVIGATTTPAVLSGWPFTVGGDMAIGCPTVENIDGWGSYEIFSTAEKIYGLRTSGSEIIDGDGVPSTPGVWSSNGGGYWSKPAIGDVTGDGIVEIVATSRYSQGTSGLGQVFVWNTLGELLWTHQVGQSNYLMASPVIANIDDDATPEIICHSRGALYAWNGDGTTVLGNEDGLLAFVGGMNAENPSAWPYAYGSPAAADLDDDGRDELVLGFRTNLEDDRSRLVVVDGDGTVLAAQDLEIPSAAEAKDANSSPSLADTDDDGIYEIYLTTRNYVWCFYYDKNAGALKPEDEWPTYGRVQISKQPSNWVESTVAIGDINGDGALDIAFGAGLGKIMGCRATDGVPFLNYSITTSSSKVGSPILVQLDQDPAAEVIVGDNNGVLFAYDVQTGEQIPGFPYSMGGRIQHGLNLWDINRDGHPNLLIQAEQNSNVVILDISNVDFSADLTTAMARNPWTSFRHDARNTGTMDREVLTPVTLFDLSGRIDGGDAVLEWSVPAEPATFRVLRQAIDGLWRTRIEAPAATFRTEGGYLYRDTVEPGNYLYQVSGTDSDGKEIFQSRIFSLAFQPFAFRLAGAAPNPFNPRTSIRFETPGGTVSLEIVDLSGRRIRTLVDGPVLPGLQESVWDGRDDSGREVGSGVYLARLRANTGELSRKLVLLR